MMKAKEFIEFLMELYGKDAKLKDVMEKWETTIVPKCNLCEGLGQIPAGHRKFNMCANCKGLGFIKHVLNKEKEENV